MSVCIYDNPTTMARECWQDGRLLCKYDALLYALKTRPIPGDKYFFGANIGDWKTSQLVGDPKAMKEQRCSTG